MTPPKQQNLYGYCITVFTVLIYYSVLITVYTYNLKCPEYAQWRIRAKAFCPDASKFFCLYDENNDRFIDNCTKIDLEASGKKIVFRGNFDSSLCSLNRYQPFIYWTNVSTDCIFEKSKCNEEGQILYDNENTEKDASCTCDYTRGYAFTAIPRNRCFCIPSEEDCSCHIKHWYNQNNTLTSDYQCEESCKILDTNVCGQFLDRGQYRNDKLNNITINVITAETHNRYKRTDILVGCISILACVMTAVGIVSLHRLCCRQIRSFIPKDCITALIKCATKTTRFKQLCIKEMFVINGLNSNDIAIIPESLLIIADYNGKRLIKFNLIGKLLTYISIPGRPGRIAVLNRTTVAVTILELQKIVIINVENGLLKKEINVLAECRGIMFTKNQIYVGCENEKNLKVIDEAYVLRRCIQTTFWPKNICAGVDGRAYCSDNFEYDLLFCIDILSGKVLFTFQHLDMKGPRGITMDDNGNLLVVCAKSKNVLQITPDLKHCYSIIKEIPISVEYPSICYDPLTNHVVISEADKIFIYGK